MGYFNLINLKGWKPVTTWLNCLDSCWYHWRFGQSHKLFIYNETMKYNRYTSEIIWASLRYSSVYSKLGVLQSYFSCTCTQNILKYAIPKQVGNATCKIPHAINTDWTALQLLNSFLGFSKLTKSFMCFEGLPVLLKVGWKNGTVR